MLHSIISIVDTIFELYWIILHILIYAMILSHSNRFWSATLANCKNKQIDEQTRFLMQANYQKLLNLARSKGLVSKPIKKPELCKIIATYQLS